jgi:MFS family permease
MAEIRTYGKNYESWFLSQGVVGFVNAGGAAFLVAPMIIKQGGSPADAGMIVGLLPFVALLSPIFGNFADRFRIHREMVLAGLVALVLASITMSFAEQELTYVVGALLFGTGGGLVIVANLGMLAGSGLDEDVMAKRMGLLQMSLPAGQFIALGISAALLAAGVELQTMFLMHAAIAAIAFLVMWPLTKGPADRIAGQLDATEAAEAAVSGASGKRLGFAAIVFSGFGLFLLINFLSQFGEQIIESQYPNYLNDVFKIEPDAAALAMAVAVLISAPLYPISGRWTAKKGPKVPFLASMAVRTATVAGLAFISIGLKDAGDGVQTLALLLYGLMIVVYPFFEVNTSLIAAKTSPIGPGGGQGFQGGATNLAGILGGFTAGWLANQAGYDTLAWVAMGLGAASFALGFFLKIEAPAESEPERPGDDAVARGAVAAMAASTGRGSVPQQRQSEGASS